MANKEIPTIAVNVSEYGKQIMVTHRHICEDTKVPYQLLETHEQYNMLSDDEKKYAVVFYHGKCNDGVFGAFFSSFLYLMEGYSAIFYRFSYGEKAEEEFFKSEISRFPYMKPSTRVKCVDFCHTPEFYDKLVLLGPKRIDINDHHKKAAISLFGEDCACRPKNHMSRIIGSSFFTALIDQESCGAHLAYVEACQLNYCVGVSLHSMIRKLLIKCQDIVIDIKNRDLWLKVNPKREQAVHILFSQFQDDPVALLDYIHHSDLEQKIQEKFAVLEYQDQLCASIAKRAVKRKVKLPGKTEPIEVMAVCCPPELTSNTAEVIYNQHQHLPVFLYSLGSDRAYFGLRSHATGPDVCDIAMQFEGGGHPHASGFSVPIVEFVSLFCD